MTVLADGSRVLGARRGSFQKDGCGRGIDANLIVREFEGIYMSFDSAKAAAVGVRRVNK